MSLRPMGTGRHVTIINKWKQDPVTRVCSEGLVGCNKKEMDPPTHA
jgi:hypothetical protein